MPSSSKQHWITWEESDGVNVVRFTTPDLRDDQVIRAIFEQIDQLLLDTNRNSLLLNFIGVDRFASYTIGKLVTLNKRLQPPQGRLALCCLTEIVEEIFDIMRLRRQFNIYRSEQEALESFPRG
jgi:anti-anti-sigma factor